MQSISSFWDYGEVDDMEEFAYQRRTRRRMLIILFSSIVLIGAVVGVVVGAIHKKINDDSSSPSDMTPAESIKAVCSVTQYPDLCFSSLSTAESNDGTTDPEGIFKISLLVTLRELVNLTDYTDQLVNQVSNPLDKAALEVCENMFVDAAYHLNESISLMTVTQGQRMLTTSKIEDLKTWLSTVITNQKTCLDSLEEMNSTYTQQYQTSTQNSTKYASNSLAIVTKLLTLLSRMHLPMHRKLLNDDGFDFPDWVTAGDRRLLQAENPTPNVVVAKDGSGQFETIKEALKQVPLKKNGSRFVIYVKEGVYKENVEVDKKMWNVMIYGDGKTKTIVTGKLNHVDGTPTFRTATFAAAGKGFFARDIGFQNTAGPAKHQAVAFRSGSDFSVMYRCAFDAYQDTLYAHSNRQFYRECDITGSVDFIFGNSAVVLQNCSIRPRQPLPHQYDTITAQGKVDPNQNTGISIQKSTISANGNLTVETYLGRPCKDYATTLFMQSYIGSLVNPKGWREWIQDVTPPKTIFYGEYKNFGPGSNTSGRVTWPGYRPALTQKQAQKFAVNNFVQGNSWLPETEIPFDPSL